MSREEIEDLYRRAEGGNLDAQNELAARLASGDGCDKDIERAVYWYQKAAAKSSPEALYNLALMHLMGEGVEKSLDKAVSNLLHSADVGGADACLLLAEAYEDEELGFNRDLSKAVKFYLRAARLGSAKGIRRIGEILERQELPVDEISELMRNFEM